MQEESKIAPKQEAKIVNPQDRQTETCPNLQKIQDISQNHFHQTEAAILSLNTTLTNCAKDEKYVTSMLKTSEDNPIDLKRYTKQKHAIDQEKSQTIF